MLPLIRSSAIRPEEEQLRSRLEAIEDDLRRGTASKGRINEMWGVVGQLTALKARDGSAAGGEGMEWAVVDEDGLNRLTRVSLYFPVLYLGPSGCLRLMLARRHRNAEGSRVLDPGPENSVPLACLIASVLFLYGWAEKP